MPTGIHVLSPTTVKVLGSSQALADATAVVKELIDNALDAAATSIVVDVSANVLDVVQVRDNGHGIPPESRALIAKQHCTSKISTQHDLQTVKGRTLGFRGEALSHILSISGSMSVTTSVEGEETACRINPQRDGSIKDNQRTSHPVGTTVRVEGLFKHYPVRHEHLRKSYAKSIHDIKSVLLTYAFARPTVRFAFSVLKSSASSDRLVLTPTMSNSVLEHARKIAGHAATARCHELTFRHSGLVVQALLPRGAIVPCKAGTPSTFVSIDGRPMNTTRGLGKLLIGILNEKLGSMNSDLRGVKNSLIVVQISSGDASYDVNIEPAKDDVLFYDMDTLLCAMNRMLDAAVLDRPTEAAARQSLETITNWQTGISIDPAAEFLTPTCMEPRMSESSDPIAPASPASLLAEGEDTNELREQYCDSSGSTAKKKKDVMAFNPWVVARLNAQSERNGNCPPSTSDHHSGRISVPLVDVPPLLLNQSTEPFGLLTPGASSPVRGPLNAELLTSPPHMNDLTDQGFLPLACETGFTSINQGQPSSYALPRHNGASQLEPVHERGTALSAIREKPNKRQQGQCKARGDRVKKPSKPPQRSDKDQDREAWFDLPERERDERARKRQQMTNSQVAFGSFPGLPGHSEVSTAGSDIRTFLRPQRPPQSDVPSQQTKEAERSRHDIPDNIDDVQLSSIAALLKSPRIGDFGQENVHPSRQVIGRGRAGAAEAATRMPLLEVSTNAVAVDSRHILMQPRTKSGRMRRAKSSILPLERTPPRAGVQDLVLRLSISVSTECVNDDILRDFFEREACFSALSSTTSDPTAAHTELNGTTSDAVCTRLVLGLRHLLERHHDGPDRTLCANFDGIVRSALQGDVR